MSPFGWKRSQAGGVLAWNNRTAGRVERDPASGCWSAITATGRKLPKVYRRVADARRALGSDE